MAADRGSCSHPTFQTEASKLATRTTLAMAVTSSTAKQLCTKSEYELFSESLARNIQTLSERGLKSRVGRARKLRDKYRQLANRQDREASGKQSARRGQPAQGSAATRKKEEIFAEAVTRFEARLATVESAPSAATSGAKTAKKRAVAGGGTKKKAAAKKKVVAKKKTAAKTSAAKKKRAVKKSTVAAGTGTASKKPRKKKTAAGSQTAPSTARSRAVSDAKDARFTAAGKMRKQKHNSAENRRQQARRDSK